MYGVGIGNQIKATEVFFSWAATLSFTDLGKLNALWGFDLSSNQILLLSKQPVKMKLASKVVKIDSN